MEENMRKSIRIIVAALIMIAVSTFCLAGCASKEENSTEVSNSAAAVTSASETTRPAISGQSTFPPPDGTDFHGGKGGFGGMGGMDNSQTDVTDISTGITSGIDPSNQFSTRDGITSYDEAACTVIDLSQMSQSVNLTNEGLYLITGTLSNGQLVVNAPKTAKIQIILKNASISSDEVAILINQADKVFITLAENSVNEISGAIVSKADLTINGNGSLTIDSPISGIDAKDDLAMTGGTIAITSSEHGIEANDSIRIFGGTFMIDSDKDGLHCSNSEDIEKGYIFISGGSFDINAAGDGIDASGEILITGGEFEIVSGGGAASSTKDHQPLMDFRGMTNSTVNEEEENSSSSKGIKSDSILMITGGTFSIDSSDDAVHSNGSVKISGGKLQLSSGDDGIHSESQLEIADGAVTITTSYEGIEGAVIVIRGGIVNVTSSDDGLNATTGTASSQNPMTGDSSALVVISGGELTVNAGGDGVDSNGSLLVTGGTTVVFGPVDGGNGAVDYGIAAKITGGAFIAFGSSQMAQNFGGYSTQGSILAASSSQQPANSLVTLTDENGEKLIVSLPSAKSFNSVVVSTPEVIQGSTYNLTLGNQTKTITMTDTIYSESSGFGKFQR